MAEPDTDKPVEIVPTIGRIVWYKMTSYEATEINQRRKDFYAKVPWYLAVRPGAQVHQGNEVEAGDLYPAMIVAVWGDQPDSCVNLKVFLDGTDEHWSTSRTVGEREGDYQWMPYQKGQAAKAEALEKKVEAMNTPAEPPAPVGK